MKNPGDPLSQPSVRIPVVMAGYACARTGVCCHAPFRAAVVTGERARIRDTITRAGGAALAARFDQTLGPERAGSHLLEQRAGRCRLHDSPHACSLHAGAGLEAMPALCRNFPRSVLRTGPHWEVAYVLACPTAASLVARAPAPMGWRVTDGGAYPYLPTRRLPRQIHLTWQTRIDREALESLRTAWWGSLNEAALDPEALLRRLVGLTTHPAEPGGRTEDSADWPGLPEPLAHGLARAAARLGGPAPPIATLTAPVSRAELLAMLGVAPQVFACAAGLGVQLACGHVAATVEHGLRLAGWQTLMSAVLVRALRDAPRALPIALCAGAQVGCEGLFSELRLLE